MLLNFLDLFLIVAAGRIDVFEELYWLIWRRTAVLIVYQLLLLAVETHSLIAEHKEFIADWDASWRRTVYVVAKDFVVVFTLVAQIVRYGPSRVLIAHQSLVVAATILRRKVLWLGWIDPRLKRRLPSLINIFNCFIDRDARILNTRGGKGFSASFAFCSCKFRFIANMILDGCISHS